MDLPGDAAQQCGSVLNNQLPIASIPTLSPAHTIHLGHKNNLHPHSLTTVAGETVSAGLLKSNRVLLSPLQHQEQLICAFREPETNGSLSTLLPTLAQPQSTQFASNPESWNGKSNLLRVQPNQFQLIDYGFIEEFHTRPPSTGFATVRNESGHVAIGQRLSPTEYTDHKNRRLQTNANESSDDSSTVSSEPNVSSSFSSDSTSSSSSGDDLDTYALDGPPNGRRKSYRSKRNRKCSAPILTHSNSLSTNAPIAAAKTDDPSPLTMNSNYHSILANSNSASLPRTSGADSYGQRHAIGSFNRSLAIDHSMAASIKCTGNSADISSNLNGNQVPGSPCTWRKYLPMAGGPLRLVNHRISAHPDGPTPVELNFIKNQSIRNDTNAEPEHVSNNGHLSDTDCGRKCPATGRESLSYGQLLGSPMVSRRTIGNGKFQSLEKNLKLLKSNALTSAPIETTLHSTRSTHLLRRQASFVGETFMNRNASNESTKPFGSSWSLASAATAPIDSTLSNKLDRPQAGGHHEMRKLKRELQLSHQKVGSLTCQLNTNAQMVSAYEQSLSAMTARVAQLSSLSQQKDAEMQRLMQIVEQLGGDHHHHTATMSTDNGHDSRSNVETNSNDDHHNQRKPNSLIRRHTFTSGSDQFRMKASLTGQSLTGNDEIDSKCRNKKSAKSLKTMRPNTGIVVASNDSIGLSAKNSWLRSSLTKAFRKQKNGSNLPSPEHSTKVTGSALTTDSSVNDSSHPVHLSYQHHANRLESESGNIEPDNVVELKRQLRMTESQLTEVRLESLNGAHQLDSLRELVEQLRHQLTNVQQENERLCKFVQHKSLASSKSSMHSISSGALNAVLSPNSSTNMPITSGNCIPLSVHTPPIHCAADKPTSCNAVAVDTGHDGITSLASPFTLMTNLVSNQPIVTTTAITSTSPSSSPAAKPSETTIKVLVNSFSTSSCTTNGSVDSSSVSGSKLVQSNSNNSSGHTLHDTLNEPDEHFLNALSDDLSISWTSGCEVDQDVVGVMCSVVLPDWLDSGKIKSKTSSSLQLALTSGSDAAEDNSCVCLGQFWVTGETSWLQMDEKVQARIAQYLSLMDPDRSIGLTLHSFIGYRIGLEPALRSFASSLAFSHRNSASTRSSLSFRNSFGSEADCALSLWSNDHCSSPTSSSSSPSNAQLTQSPYSYLVDRPTLQIQLATRLDHFCLQTQIPRCTLLRFLSVLGDHRRLLIHGPTGSGKSQSARLLAQYLVNRNASKRGSFSRADMECNIATCQATATNEDELHSNFASTADQWQMHLQSNCQSLPDTLPIVMLIDDLQHWKNSDLTLAPLFSMPANNGPFVIATMTEVNSSSLSIQPLIHNVITNHFRLLHFDVHTEPVRGYLRRLLRARLLQHIARQQSKSNHPSDCGCWLPVKRCNRSLHRTRQIQSIIRIVDWLVQVWQRSNHFLETHHSSSVALGPRIFDTCPVDTPDAIRRWFEQLWNSSIAPYLIQAARDGLRKNHLRSQFEDPCEWIQRTYPWKRAQRSNTDESICSVTSNHDPSALLFSQSIGLTFNLRKILAEDIGMEVERDDDDEMSAEPNHLQPKSSQDVLSETLNKLQKCAIESN